MSTTASLPPTPAAPGDRPRLTFAARRRGQPPRPPAALSREDRAKLCRQSCTPMTRGGAAMRGLRARERGQHDDERLPALRTEVHTLQADAGATRKTLWSAFDGAKGESVLMGYCERDTRGVSSQ